MRNLQVSCPVDGTRINEYQVRFTAAHVVLVSAFFLVTRAWQLPAFLVVDFLTRARFTGRYSLLWLLSGWIVKFTQLGVKPVNGAPKKFAAGIGVMLAVIMLSLALNGLHAAAEVTGAIIGLFALLESVAGFCAGCYVYHFFVKYMLIGGRRPAGEG